MPHRPPRSRPRQRNAERGLPPLEDQLKLAKTYLYFQHRLWPAAAVADGNLLPSPDDRLAVERMVNDLAQRHRTGRIDAATLDPFVHRYKKLGGAYLRYSCDHSNPRSLDDQLTSVLTKAVSQQLFIPWALVFTDASVTGMDAGRQGYGSLKAVLNEHHRVVPTILIDEFTRASRDTLEWFRLALACKRLRVNVLGASDGFVLDSPTGETMLHVYGMLSRFFISQLRDKVLRGMKGAARRQTSVGRPRLGYGLMPRLDAQGNPMLGTDGRTICEKVVHGPTMAYVIMAANWYARLGKSYNAIAREFSRLKVDGSAGWRSTSIRALLSDPIYIGIAIFNKTSNHFDPETHVRTTVRNPSSQWIIEQVPHLRVWSDDLWKAVRRRAYQSNQRRRAYKASLDESGRSKGGGSVAGARNADSPTTLLSGTLFCQCGQELKLVRSGKHAAMGCYHGRDGVHGCTMTTVKANAIVEEAVLGFVLEQLLDEQRLAKLVDRVNAALDIEAAKPQPELAPLKAELARLTKHRNKLVGLLLGEESQKYLRGVTDQIKRFERQMGELSVQIVAAERQNQPAPPPLRLEDIRRYLIDLPALLREEPAAAGLALRKITGPITVQHQRHVGKKGGRWILSFAPTILTTLLQQAVQSGDPQARTIAQLQTTQLHEGGTVTLVVDKRPSVSERLAPQVALLQSQINPQTGERYTVPQIAQILGSTVDVTYLASTLARKANRRESEQAPGAPPSVPVPCERGTEDTSGT